MEGETSTLESGTAPPPSLPPVMENDRTANSPAMDELATAPVHASASVIEFDGRKGGRERLDGLTPGSQSAIDADRMYERIRKWEKDHPGEVHHDVRKCCDAMQQKFAARRGDIGRIAGAKHREATQPRPVHLRPSRIITPQPLPSALPETPLPDTATVDTLADSAAVALDAWSGTDFEPLLAELVKALQEFRNLKRERQMMVAQFPKDVQEQISRESEWPEGIEKLLCKHVSRILAKLATSASLPIAYKDEILGASAFITLVSIEIRTSARINKMIVLLKQNPPPK